MAEPTLSWGLLGTARINRAVIPPLQASARNRLVAVASRTQARAEAHAAEWGIARALGSYEALLADPSIDVIYIGLPNGLHAEWAVKAMRAGKHVLCEKPLATTVADVDAIAAASAETGRITAEAFMYRHHPQTALVRRLVRDGAVGELRLIRGAFTFLHAREQDVRWDPDMGGGSLWDVGCYPVSYARFVIGAEPVRVKGWQRLAPGGVDETFVGMMEFSGGVLATCDSGFRSPFHTRIEIAGTKGQLRLSNPFKPALGDTVELVRPSGTETIVAPDQDLYSGEIENLADAILDGASPEVSLADSRGTVAAIVALYESARADKWVRPQL
jgi:predicted dehydrogenase